VFSRKRHFAFAPNRAVNRCMKCTNIPTKQHTFGRTLAAGGTCPCHLSVRSVADGTYCAEHLGMKGAGVGLRVVGAKVGVGVGRTVVTTAAVGGAVLGAHVAEGSKRTGPGPTGSGNFIDVAIHGACWFTEGACDWFMADCD
jgi:hypothetical protein